MCVLSAGFFSIDPSFYTIYFHFEFTWPPPIPWFLKKSKNLHHFRKKLTYSLCIRSCVKFYLCVHNKIMWVPIVLIYFCFLNWVLTQSQVVESSINWPVWISDLKVLIYGLKTELIIVQLISLMVYCGVVGWWVQENLLLSELHLP